VRDARFRRASLPTALAQAQHLASQSRFDDFLVNCRQIIDRCSDDPETLLSVGTLLLNFGYLTRARECFERVRVLVPNDSRPVVNLANVAREAGEHGESRRLYGVMARCWSGCRIIRSSAAMRW